MKQFIQRLVKAIASITTTRHKVNDADIVTHRCTRSNFLFIPISEPDKEGYIWYACDHPGCKNIAMFHPLKDGQKQFNLNTIDSEDELETSGKEVEKRIKVKIAELYKHA